MFHDHLTTYDDDQDMRGLQVNDHDQGSMLWIKSPLEEPDPSQIYK
jgi:hypothetical protein